MLFNHKNACATFSASRVTAGTPVTGTATLSGPAPVGGVRRAAD